MPIIAHAKAEHERRREQHRNKGAKAPQMSLRPGAREEIEARLGRLHAAGPAASSGVRIFEDYPLAELVPYIDWMPFFNAWEFAGKFPDILRDPVIGEAASNLYADAQAHARTPGRGEMAAGARRRSDSFPANSVGDDDIDVYADETRAKRRLCACIICASRSPSRRIRRNCVCRTSSRRRKAAAPTTSERSP